MMEPKSLGHIAYDAYGETCAWLTVDGRQMPSWPSVRADIQGAWETAARAVCQAVRAAQREAEEAWS